MECFRLFKTNYNIRWSRLNARKNLKWPSRVLDRGWKPTAWNLRSLFRGIYASSLSPFAKKSYKINNRIAKYTNHGFLSSVCIPNKLGGTKEPLFIEPHILWLMDHFHATSNQNHALTQTWPADAFFSY